MKTIDPRSRACKLLEQEDKGDLHFYLLSSGHYYYIAHRHTCETMAIIDAEIPNDALWLAYKVYDLCYMQIGDPTHIVKLVQVLADEKK